jgi:hypothetical protein
VRIAFFFAVLALLAACGDDASDRPPPPTVAAEPETAAAPEDGDRLFDIEGNLRESEVVVAGLTLPRGLEPAGELERFHAYRSSVPIEKIQAYFGPRLITGQVDRHGSSAIFREAVPREARGGIVKLDVSIIPMNTSTTRIEIREILPPPTTLPTEAEIIRHWNEEQPRLD